MKSSVWDARQAAKFLHSQQVQVRSAIDRTEGAHGNIPALTGIRGIGALWVLLYHLHNIDALLWGQASGAGSLFSSGYFGVDLFFVLSGFIICHVHYADFQHDLTWSSFGRYLTLRILRIYPLHLAATLLLVILVILFPAFADFQTSFDNSPQEFSVHGLIASLLLVQNWGHWFGVVWNGQSWTLSVELLLYLSFPVLCIFLRGAESPRKTAFIAFAILVAFGLVMELTGSIDKNQISIRGIVRGFAEFTSGCLLSRFFHLEKDRNKYAAACLASLVLIFVALSFPVARFLIYAAFGLLILSLAHRPRIFERLFGSGVMLWIGEVSFSLYLLHLLVVHVSFWLLSTYLHAPQGPVMRVTIVGSVLGACLLMAWLGYNIIERPGRRLGRQVAARYFGAPQKGITADSMRK